MVGKPSIDISRPRKIIIRPNLVEAKIYLSTQVSRIKGVVRKGTPRENLRSNGMRCRSGETLLTTNSMLFSRPRKASHTKKELETLKKRNKASKQGPRSKRKKKQKGIHIVDGFPRTKCINCQPQLNLTYSTNQNDNWKKYQTTSLCTYN